MQDLPFDGDNGGPEIPSNPLTPEDMKFLDNVQRSNGLSKRTIVDRIEMIMRKEEDMLYNDLSLILSFILDDYLLRKYKGIVNLDKLVQHSSLPLVREQISNSINLRQHPKEIGRLLYALRLRSKRKRRVVECLLNIKSSINSYLQYSNLESDDNEFLQKLSDYIDEIQRILDI